MATRTSATRWIPLLLVAVWLTGCGDDPAAEPGTEPVPAAVTPTDGQTAASPPADAPPSDSSATVAEPSRAAPRIPPASPRANGGGLNAGTPLRIPLPQDRLTSLKLPEAVEKLAERIATACGGEACVAVLVQATQEEPPVPGQSCDDVLGVVGMAEDELGAPYFEAVAGGSVTLLTNIRCGDVPEADPSDRAEPPWEQPDSTGDGGSEAPEGTSGTSAEPDSGADGTAEGGDLQPDVTDDSTP